MRLGRCDWEKMDAFGKKRVCVWEKKKVMRLGKKGYALGEKKNRCVWGKKKVMRLGKKGYAFGKKKIDAFGKKLNFFL